MAITAALYLTALSLTAPAPSGAAPTLRLDAGLVAPAPQGLTLRSEVFGLDGDALLRARALAQTAQGANQAASQAASDGASACGDSCDIDCETCRESDRAARYVLRRRARNLRAHRYFAIAAWGSMLVTEVLGTIRFIQSPSWFGDGSCRSDLNAFGCENASMITGFHQAFAFITTGLYTTAGVIAATAPDPENASVGEDLAARTLRRHKTLAYVHAAGMILMPILGVLTANPQVLGIDTPSGRESFQRNMNSIHALVGYSTFAAFTAAGILEF
ncbi:MAG: hypothetical protein JNK72_24065 [Myxococcales bacterium]|nr:hypothetical protein [Myxococcales bacterium]